MSTEIMPVPPNQTQIDHSMALSGVIAESINNNDGWISFEQYMNTALYAPGLGYYGAGANKIGGDGDFITAPSLGQQFAACLARQCGEILKNLKSEQPAMLVEFGAGTGQLALDLLAHLDTLHSLPQQYLMVETSPELQQRQNQLIKRHRPDLLNIVSWVDHVPVNGVCGVIIANELLDALPVKRFQIDPHGQARELGVALRDGEFVWQLSHQSLSNMLQQRLLYNEGEATCY